MRWIVLAIIIREPHGASAKSDTNGASPTGVCAYSLDLKAVAKECNSMCRLHRCEAPAGVSAYSDLGDGITRPEQQEVHQCFSSAITFEDLGLFLRNFAIFPGCFFYVAFSQFDHAGPEIPALRGFLSSRRESEFSAARRIGQIQI